MRRVTLGSLALLGALAIGGDASARGLPGDVRRASRARDAIFELDVTSARKILNGADPNDAALALERARLAIYEGDYDAAVVIASRQDIAASGEGGELSDIAHGCARAMAGALIVKDEARGVIVRMQDDADKVLVPLLADVVDKVRAQLVKDLGVELPRPLHIDLVRDQFSLAAMTGLPEQAAQTTGTVAVAKWGRVTMLTPRATYSGYPWLDTLAHEMTHLALTQGTRDKAPLWLQEGVAKREETRWREKEPLDDVPSIDAVAISGIEKGLGRSLDKLGPSIAMLPTAEQAQVAFAEVQSFVRYYVREQGDDALAKLVVALKEGDGDGALEAAIKRLSGLDFVGWDKKWRAHIASVPHDLPPDLAPGAELPKGREIGRRVRLGDLLHQRKHEKQSISQYTRAQAMVPFDASIRAYLGEVLVVSGDRDKAKELLAKTEDIHGKHGRWWSLHGMLAAEGPDAERAFAIGIALDPLDAHVACEEKDAPALPVDVIRAAICSAARAAEIVGTPSP